MPLLDRPATTSRPGQPLRILGTRITASTVVLVTHDGEKRRRRSSQRRIILLRTVSDTVGPGYTGPRRSPDRPQTGSQARHAGRRGSVPGHRQVGSPPPQSPVPLDYDPLHQPNHFARRDPSSPVGSSTGIARRVVGHRRAPPCRALPVQICDVVPRLTASSSVDTKECPG